MAVGQLDRESPMPLWAQLESDLRARLDAGEFDERFPTDGQLVEEYGVSRHTVREAIRHLNKSGILRRERGRGTVVTGNEFVQPLGALYSLYQSVESSGVEQRSDVLALERRTDPEVAARLELDADAELVFLERLRYAAEQPLALDAAWLPADVAEPLLGVDFRRTGLYAELESCCGVQPDEGWERIEPVVPSATQRDQLGMGRSDAAFSIERLSSFKDRPIEWRITVIRGDRYRFMSTWTQGAAPALRADRDH